MDQIKLTQFSHGGGCGCKIAPAVLSKLLAHAPAGLVPPDLLVGTETADDAAVYRLNDRQAIVATTDFFTPIVDDPYDFGRIAATNALSDVYAMGGRPIMALAIVGMPIDKLPPEVIGRILEGGASVCRDAGIPIAGGHSIDVLEPIYGLVGLGVVDPAQVKTNAGAKAGDVLILTKPLGIGILSAGLKKGLLEKADYAAMLHWTTLLNRVGMHLAGMAGVHAVTDVTGFGLAGHLLEICRGSNLTASVSFGEVPTIDAALRLVRDGIATGASTRNWASYGESIRFAPEAPEWQRKLVTDPQTSGGLLIACAPDAVDEVLAAIRAEQGSDGRVIGRMEVGEPLLRIV
ncbi:Selenide,water dikinase (EC 2.7.9.3) (Selenophosphate synthetase) (Selenium donor protein), gene: SELD [Aromatoleum aromaticum EbN1]|uniref:Selenide, water dikinase n=1 Tax=Aromatoleum aromaticum (strain DSM 19018 / LMG 30748 / EbN1) TaxID=76114 RepID=Q5NY43_AROAE|nr:selenide, water dikinase SelD [Aromatoleum aromaticum]CAI10021.1 Selenide,water dikinase (EC 2.7.9.3) (Selenophosphate synthetase) (Selenium donor protein), gene: SELD [Aromatoleum aromaticum EbN1]